MNKRLEYIDTAKGIGIIFVVLNHHLLGAEYLLTNWITSFHMPLFFMITGYLFAYKNDFNKSVRKIIVKKAKGLMYPYFTLSIVVILWNFFFYSVLFPTFSTENTIIEIILLTITTYGYHALWFIPCLFYSSVIFLILRKYHIHHLIWIIPIAFVVVFSVMPSAEVFSLYPVRFIIRILIGMMFILFGYLLFLIMNRVSKAAKIVILFFTGLVFAGSFAGYYYFPSFFPFVNIAVCHIENPAVYLLLALCNATFLILLSKLISNKVLGFFGKNSIIIMAFHMDLTIEIAWLVVGMIPWNVDTMFQSVAVVVIELLMLSLISVLINRFVPFLYRYDRLPFLRK